jgi:hypothetical protein
LAALSPAAAKAVTDWNVPLAAGGAQFIASSSGSSNGPGGNFYVGINLPYTSGSTGGQLALRLSPANTEMWFRAANGTGAPWMQAVAADQSGNATVDGTLTVASGFVSGGTGSTVVFGCAVGAAANVTLRPNGINSAVGQFYVKPTGEVVANGPITAPAIALGSGKTLSKITVSSAAPGTLADGELYLQY